jgi:hypothetical protein
MVIGTLWNTILAEDVDEYMTIAIVAFCAAKCTGKSLSNLLHVCSHVALTYCNIHLLKELALGSM